MASLNVGNLGNLGEFLREQRRGAQLSLRQLADAAGVSNPYLSQIERGLRKPSAEILQQLAKALRISAETLYVQAGILDERDQDGMEVRAAILADPLISERQKQVLLQIYDSFRKEHAASHPAAESAAGRGEGDQAQAGGPEADGSAPGVRARGGAAARTAAKKAAAKVADAVAEVAETVGSRSRALKAAAPHDDDKDGTKRTTGTSRPLGSAAAREATGPETTGPGAAAGAAEPGAASGA